MKVNGSSKKHFIYENHIYSFWTDYKTQPGINLKPMQCVYAFLLLENGIFAPSTVWQTTYQVSHRKHTAKLFCHWVMFHGHKQGV